MYPAVRTTSKKWFHVWRTNLRLAAYAAIAARPMSDYQRMIEMLAICRLSASSSLDVNRALNIHIGLFGYNERQTRAVMNPHVPSASPTPNQLMYLSQKELPARLPAPFFNKKHEIK